MKTKTKTMCDMCNEEQATVITTEVNIDGEETTANLCKVCKTKLDTFCSHCRYTTSDNDFMCDSIDSRVDCYKHSHGSLQICDICGELFPQCEVFAFEQQDGARTLYLCQYCYETVKEMDDCEMLNEMDEIDETEITETNETTETKLAWCGYCHKYLEAEEVFWSGRTREFPICNKCFAERQQQQQQQKQKQQQQQQKQTEEVKTHKFLTISQKMDEILGRNHDNE